MARKTALKDQFAAYRAAAAAFVNAVNGSKSGRVQHSETNAILEKEGQKGLAKITVDELITIVRTAKVLGKEVILDAGNNEKGLTLIVRFAPPVPTLDYDSPLSLNSLYDSQDAAKTSTPVRKTRKKRS